MLYNCFFNTMRYILHYTNVHTNSQAEKSLIFQIVTSEEEKIVLKFFLRFITSNRLRKCYIVDDRRER